MSESKLYITIVALLLSVQLYAQKENSFPLDTKLNEISGLETLNDSLFVAINDGGNGPDIYVIDQKGSIKQKVKIKNASNKDWEDIAADADYFYVGDIGNNLNKRKDLCIYRIKKQNVKVGVDEISADKITYRYADQKEFPPKEEHCIYDAEGMIVENDLIWIFTKNRAPAKTTTGMTYIYKLPTKPGDYTIEQSDSIFIGTSGWLKDGITAADQHKEKLYLLTYNRLLVFKNNGQGFELVKTIKMGGIAQRESLVVLKDSVIFVADERHRLLGKAKIYKLKN